MKTHSLVAISSFISAAALGAQKAPDITPYLTPDRVAEIALARTAAPADISGKATILVLTAKGYVEAVHGTNGFTCAVLRSFAGAPDDPKFWNPHTSGPACFNPPATRTVLPATLTTIDWALAGASTAELNARIKKAYAERKFVMPAPGAMAYMLSPKQHLSETNPHWMPHLMFFYGRTVDASALGAGAEPAPIISTDPKSPVLTFLVPTRAWSDGTPAVRATSVK
jgi:hypothetical protein